MSSGNKLTKEEELWQSLCRTQKELYEKDTNIKRINHEFNDLKRDNFELKHKITDFNVMVNAKNKLIEETRKQLFECKISLEEKTHKINSLTEIVKKDEKKIKMLSTEKTHSDTNISHNKIQIEDMNKEIEDLKAMVKLIEEEESKYKELYEDLRSDNQNIRKQLKNNCNECEDCEEEKQTLENENRSLRVLCEHYKLRSNCYKQQVLAVSHTAIKTHELYANSLRENHEKDRNVKKELLQELRQNIIEEINNFDKNIDRKTIENLAKTVDNLDENMEHIHKKQRLMEEKTAHGKVNCGSCEQTFVSTGYLKHHMLTAHHMNTTDLSKNYPQILQID